MSAKLSSVLILLRNLLNVTKLIQQFLCFYWGIFSENPANVLDWRQRRAIAIGTAKGLRFLHEECRGSPIIHRDLRPSNVLLTHDFVPMVNFTLYS